LLPGIFADCDRLATRELGAKDVARYGRLNDDSRQLDGDPWDIRRERTFSGVPQGRWRGRPALPNLFL
jgi:hypothetical protein